MICNFEKDRFHRHRGFVANLINRRNENAMKTLSIRSSKIPNFTDHRRVKTKMDRNCNCVRKWKYSPSRYSLQASRVQTRVNQTRTQDQSCCTASLFLTEPNNRQANAFTTDFSKRPRRHLTFSSGRDKLWRSRRTSQSRGSLIGCATRTDRRFVRFVRRMNYDCGGQGRHDRSGTMGIHFLLRALQAKQSVDERLDVPFRILRTRSGVWNIFLKQKSHLSS